MSGYWLLVIGRRVQYEWSKYPMWLWSTWTVELGLLGVVYISNLRVPQVAVFW